MKRGVSGTFINDALEIAPRVSVSKMTWTTETLLKIATGRLIEKLFFGPYELNMLDDDTCLVFQRTPDVVRPSGHLAKDYLGNCGAVILTRGV